MGAGESKPALKPRAPHIYATNRVKGVKEIFLRVQGDKLRETKEFTRIMDEDKGMVAAAQATGKLNNHHKDEKEKERRIHNSLIHGGFNHFPFGETMPFPAENDGHLMYVSVHDGDKMRLIDMAVDLERYGCVTIKGDRGGISVHPPNPKPCWVQLQDDCSSLSSKNLLEVERRSNDIPVYLGRAIWQADLLDPERHHVLVCKVWQEKGKLCVYPDMVSFIQLGHPRISALSATRYEWVRAETGNPVPVNAVRVSDEDGSQPVYLGRIHGDRACGITEVDGMFNKFIASMNVHLLSGDQLTASTGEVLLLTAEPMQPRDGKRPKK